MKLDFDCVIITSDEPYSKMWHTQLIYAEFIAKENTVYFINPPARWTIKNIFKNSLKKINENKNLTLFNYNNKLPITLKLFNAFNERYNEKKIANELKKINAKKLIIWHFDSFRCAFKNNFFNRSLSIKRIYHVIDPFYNNPIDTYLCKIADAVVITSPRINNFYTKFLSKVINVPQCLDIELQHKLVNEENIIRLRTASNYFVLLGTISDDIDFHLILELLEITNFKLVIIGKKINITKSINEAHLVLNHVNVEYLGVLSPKEFYPILKNAQAGLIIYNEERRAKICSPLKALNYLITNLPVITNMDCEISELLGSCIYFSQNANEISNLIIKALNNELNFNMVAAEEYLQSVSIQSAINNLVRKL